MRRWARRMAMRRISWTDQWIRRPPDAMASAVFWGRQAVGVLAHPGHHGEGEHDEADVPVPAVPRTGLVVGETEFGLGGLEAVLDGPAPPLDGHEGADRDAGLAPGGEEGLVVSQFEFSG